MKKIYILDWSWFLYRAWHAYPSMISNNMQVNMIYGFYRMIIKLMMEKPDNLIIVRDAKGKTVRHDAYEPYKANRPSMPDDFGQQITLCKSMANELNIPNIECQWYEADDIIYTFCKGTTHKAQDTMYIVYTGDKDIKQILEYPDVLIRDPIKELERNKDKFIKEFGFEPQYIIDYLSLIGDASDNVPWARGIGPKWATDLICAYQTIENIYNNLNNLSEKTRTLLVDSKDNVLQAKRLITLLDIEHMCMDDIHKEFKPDIVARKEIFINKYRFNSFEKVLDELKKQRYFTPTGGLF